MNLCIAKKITVSNLLLIKLGIMWWKMAQPLIYVLQIIAILFQ